MKYNYKIYQLDANNDNVKRDHKMFESWEMLNRTAGFNFHQYKLVWDDEMDADENEFSDDDILEVIFQHFNTAAPENYFGRSMSTSDVVVLNGIKYYCDSFCWVKI